MTALADFIGILSTIDANLHPTALADALWLAQFLDPPIELDEHAQDPPQDPAHEDDETDDQQTADSTGRRGRRAHHRRADTQAEAALRAQLLLPDQTTGGASADLPFWTPTASALYAQLEIRRSLRAFKRRIPSPWLQELDIEATVRQMADARILRRDRDVIIPPVLRPTPTRWLDLHIVFDRGDSNVLWQKTVAELLRLLETLGGFRTLTTWSLLADDEGHIGLVPGIGPVDKRLQIYSMKALTGSPEQQLVLTISDAVASYWYDGTLARTLMALKPCPTVTLLQMLPRHLWRRTGLGSTVSFFRIRRAGDPNRRFQLRATGATARRQSSPPGFQLPVISLDPRAFACWGQALTGRSQLWIPGVVLPEAGASRRTAPAQLVDGQALVQDFWSMASVDARQLAGYLAATPVLSLPLIHLIQRVMLPQTTLEHLAEVYLGGLLIQRAGDPLTAPDDLRFDFKPGVRNNLLATISTEDTVEVIDIVNRQLSGFIDRNTGQALDFYTVICDPSRVESAAQGEESNVFATVAASILRRLGGDFAAVAEQLESPDHIPSPAIEPFGEVVDQEFSDIGGGDKFTQGYALLIGVDEHSIPSLSLPDVGKDIKALHEVLIHPERCGYEAEHVRVLTGAAATRQAILDGLGWLHEQLAADKTGNATAVVYYTGHGWQNQAGAAASYYLVPYDMNAQGGLPKPSTALSTSEFADVIAALPAKRLLMLFDSSHSGGFVNMNLFQPAPIPLDIFLTPGKDNDDFSDTIEGLGQLTLGEGVAIISSSRSDQKAYIRKDRSMSIFTYHLIEALTGRAQYQSGAIYILVSDIISYLHRTVARSAQEQHRGGQEPDFKLTGNFPVALLLGGKGIAADQKISDPLDPLSITPASDHYEDFDDENEIRDNSNDHPRSSDAVSQSIPIQHLPQVISFVDRDEEFKRVLGLLVPGAIVTIGGAAGIGKSALATEVSRRLAPGDEPPTQFPDGILWYSAARSGAAADDFFVDAVCEHIVRSFGTEIMSSPREEATRLLTGKRLLMILDGLDEIIGIDELTTLVAMGDQWSVLITTRHPEQISGFQHSILSLEPLPERFAVELLAELLGSTDHSRQDLSRLAQTVEHSPLALQMASRLLAQGAFTPHTLSALLEESGIDPVELLLRQILDYVSNPDARAIMTVMGWLAPEPVHLSLLATALDIAMEQLADAVTELVDRRLIIIQSDDRIALANIQLHAMSDLKSADSAMLLERLAGALADRFEKLTGQGPEGLAALDADRLHLLSVLSHCATADLWSAILRLAQAALNYLTLGGYVTDRATTLSKGVEAAIALSDVAAEIAMHTDLGTALYALGQQEKAMHEQRLALESAIMIDDKRAQSAALNNLGILLDGLGEVEEAESSFTQAVALATAVNDLAARSRALTNLGQLYETRENYAQALRYYEEALQAAQEVKDQKAEAILWGNRGNLYLAMSRLDAAVESYNQAIVLARSLGDLRTESAYIGNLGSVYHQQGQYTEALQHFSEALHVAESAGDNRLRGNSLFNLATVYDAMGRVTDAIKSCEQAIVILQQIRSPLVDSAQRLLGSLRSRRMPEQGKATNTGDGAVVQGGGTAAGARGIAIGSSVSGSTFVTGSGKTVDQIRSTFDQRGQHVGTQTNVAGGVNTVGGGYNSGTVNTGGGAYIGGNVTTGGDFVGRDQIVGGGQGSQKNLVAELNKLQNAINRADGQGLFAGDSGIDADTAVRKAIRVAEQTPRNQQRIREHLMAARTLIANGNNLAELAAMIDGVLALVW